MRDCRLRPGTFGIRRWSGLVFLVAIGCSREEPLQPDPGVSPMFPGPSAAAKATEGPGAPATATNPADRVQAAATGTQDPLRPEDVERQLRIAMRAAERGDTARAAAMLDRILALEPVNREALFGRAGLELDRASRAASPEERTSAIEKAAALARTLRRAYERPNQREIELSAKILYEEIKLTTAQGRLDEAVAVLKEAHAAGFDAFDRVESDPALARLRPFPAYQALLKEVDAANLAKARVKAKGQVERPLDLPVAFHLKDLDGKPISLDDYKGKVVLLDFWGTWCEPCRKAIPALVQMYRLNRRRGFEVLGLDYEQNAPDPETAREYVKQFVQQSGIPYRVAMGDDALAQKVKLQRFPTSILIDRQGRPRLMLAGGDPEILDSLHAAVQVLLAEPEDKGKPAVTAEPRSPAKTK